jgi:hypothetical protein
MKRLSRLQARMPILILRTGAPPGRPEHHRKSPIEIASPTLDTLKDSILTFARTEDHEYVLHPEQLVTCISSAEAKVLQKQLELFHGSRDEQPYRLQ